MARTMELKSFSVVSTEECWKELAILIFALRRFHSQPIYVLCDRYTKENVELYGFANVDFDVDANPKELMKTASSYRDEVVKNSYHRPDCIAKKMDAIERATFLYGNTLFLDSDIVPVAPLYAAITHPVMVSPHLHANNKLDNLKKYGAYNAGYVFCSEIELADAWRGIYLERSLFFEQEGMIYFHERFDVGMFPETHNIGFWRFKVGGGSMDFAGSAASTIPNVKSFHAHLTDSLFSRADDGLRRVYQEMKDYVMGYLRQRQPEIYEFADSFQHRV